MQVSEHALSVDTEYIAQQVPQRPICHELGYLPTRAEFNESLQTVKESSPDGVTANMLRKVGARVHEQLYRIVCDMFTLPALQWDQLLTEGLGVSIFKGEGSRTDLGNYRTIILLPILSRLLGRILSVRIMTYAVKSGLLSTFQWGNRKHRSVQDALFVVRTIAELAAEVACAPCNNIELESALALVFFDIRKAFPSVNRQAAFFLFQRLGFPPSLLQVLDALHSGTRYYASTAGLSEECYLASGFREGCCTSPGRYTISMTVPCKMCKDKLCKRDRTTLTSMLHFIRYLFGRAFTKKRVNASNRPRSRFLKNSAVALRIFELFAIMFADDTSMIVREGARAECEQLLQTTLQSWGETIKPSKTKRVIIHPDGAQPSSLHHEHARLLGGLVSHNASYESDH